MKFLYKIIYFSIAVLFLLSSCKTGDKKKKDKVSLDSLQTTYQAINDSLDAAWSKMIADDNEKLKNSKRLLQEVSYTNAYNKAQYEDLQEQLIDLKDMRYDRKSMANSDAIDQYDAASSQVIYKVMTFATSHPQYEEFSLMKELVKEIQDAQNRVLLMRVHYDHAAKDYNQFIEIHHELMDEIDSSETIGKQPLFELSE